MAKVLGRIRCADRPAVEPAKVQFVAVSAEKLWALFGLKQAMVKYVYFDFNKDF